MKKERTPSDSGFKQLKVIKPSGDVFYTETRMNESDYMGISPLWAKLRSTRLQMDNYKCKNCGSPINLNIHHIRYPLVWGEEDISDLVTLCDECHKNIHFNAIEEVNKNKRTR